MVDSPFTAWPWTARAFCHSALISSTASGSDADVSVDDDSVSTEMLLSCNDSSAETYRFLAYQNFNIHHSYTR